MSKESAKEERGEGEGASSEERPLGFLLTDPGSISNYVAGKMSGLQASFINGNVILQVAEGESPPGFAARKLTDQEIDEACFQFVEPGGFAEAERILCDQRLVVLHGQGSGRLHAARRLLVNRRANSIAMANVNRVLSTVTLEEVKPGSGYIWEGDSLGQRSLSDTDFQHCRAVMREANAWLVIVLKSTDQIPEVAEQCVVKLRPPPAFQVARSVIEYRWGRWGCDKALKVLERHLVDVLNDGDPPEKASRVGEAAIQVAEGEYDAGRAIEELQETVDFAVARFLRELSITELAMAVAVAVLENEPYDDVVHNGLELDRLLRESELPEDKKPRPRRVLAVRKQDLLEKIKAEVVLRDHPEHVGLREETVCFRREDWAKAVLRHAWREYPDVQAVLRKWLCKSNLLNRFAGPVQQAICTIISEIPAHKPLGLLKYLSASSSHNARFLASSVLQRLADDKNLLPLVYEILEEWVESGPAYGQWVAAITYASPFGWRNISHSLLKLRAIARSDWLTPKEAVVLGVLSMLANPRNQRAVIDAVVDWVRPCHHPGVRKVALNISLWVIGFRVQMRFDVAELRGAFPEQLQILANQVIADHDAGAVALNRLEELAEKSHWDSEAAAELVWLATLIIPDLRWWKRIFEVRKICFLHYDRRAKIRWIFHVARRMQRAQQRAAIEKSK